MSRSPSLVLPSLGADHRAGGGHGASLRFREGGDHLLAAGAGGCRLWDLERTASRVIARHGSYVYHAHFSPDGRLIASAAWDGTVRVHDSRSGDELAVFSFDVRRIKGLAFSEDGSRLVAIGSAPRMARIWDMATGEVVLTSRGYVKEVRSIYWRTARGGSKRTPEFDTQQQASSSDGSRRVRGSKSKIDLVRSSDGKLVTAGDRSNRESPFVFETVGAPVAVAMSFDGRWIASGAHRDTNSPDSIGSIRIWDVATGEAVATMSGHGGKVFSLAFSPDGSRLASAGADGIVRVWDADRHELVHELRGHERYIHSVDFSPDGTQIVTGSGDGTVRLWDTISAGERAQQWRAEDSVRQGMQSFVTQLVEALGEPAAVAESIRADATLSEEQRCAALRVLLEWCRSQPDIDRSLGD